jgi:nucleotide-binding universal stress UspA family protein
MKILLATDGSAFSDATTQAVASRLRPDGSEVLVLQVVEPLMYSTPPQMAPGYAPEMAARIELQMKQAAESVGRAEEALRAAGFKTSSRVVQAEPRLGILDVAAEWKPDLIVLGSHGRTGLQRLLMGSVAESVARHATCSVMIVRGPR